MGSIRKEEKEYFKNKYKELKYLFENITNYFGYQDISLDDDSLSSIILELSDKKDLLINVSTSQKLSFFMLEFYQIFLDKTLPQIMEILKINNNDRMLSAALLPEVGKINARLENLIYFLMKKYQLTKTDLKIVDPFANQISNFKTVFLDRNKVSSYPVFDYDIKSWQNKKEKIEEKIEKLKHSLLKEIGPEYQDTITLFEMADVYQRLKNLEPIYYTLSQSENGYELMNTWDAEFKIIEIKK